MSNNLKANSFVPVKQCIKNLNSRSLKAFFKILRVSFSADLVCTINGKFDFCEASICSKKDEI